MEFAELNPDLQQWIRGAVQRGQCQSQVMDALLKAGYQTSIARAVEQCMAGHTGPEASAPAASGYVKKPKGDSSAFRLFEPQRNLYDLGERQVEILLAMKQPNIVLFGNLLSDSECEALIEMSRERLKPSRLVNSESGSFDIGEARTSYGTYFDRGANPLIAGIESRIERLLGVPGNRGEPIQVLHYKTNTEYRPHFDFFPPDRPGNQGILAKGGQRVATLIMYLNNVEAGGSTVFPRISLDVLPKKGCGLFFSYANTAGDLDRQTLHGGSPVIAGEKWIATKWLRLGEFKVGDV
ncbi:2OG-Fe(II) oxygenase [Microbulbifer hydrolyticus]|uniref:2-oxoglutarate-dependent dioxygenase n=1 Tax=Microbulbifer hydrolyticus TaxID=48074 RepID=A0A6P1TB93_9GAMM|nr:2OG-Fe(II) oxygenase [Microbulbifer hydrolyticus]MBB5210206.1 prolyl 4-hydroxylase [Microbulbifer hydrolyticus]QHQ39287.1 2-oxoglutarate-dependent dioxygenase [Microbulbifer hydrolyticus]